jgi:hypothetical protein
MTRYFMTIPEAVQLIIRSGSLASEDARAPVAPRRQDGRRRIVRAPRGRGSEVFVLDMGEPVRILDLARAMIELSVLDPDRDVDIEIVGRRAGEKLHEELFNDYERALPTSVEKIVLADREPLAAETVESMFAEIGLLVLEGDAAGLAAKVSELSAARSEPRTEEVAGKGRVPEPVPALAREDVNGALSDGSATSRGKADGDPGGDRRDGLPDEDRRERDLSRRVIRENSHTTSDPLIHSRDP